MNEKELLFALNDVDERFIMDAAPEKQRKVPGRWLKWGALAACLVLVVSLAVWTPSFLRMGSSSLAATNTAEDTCEAAEAAYDNARDTGGVQDISGAVLFPEELCSAVSKIDCMAPDGETTAVKNPEQIAQAMELLSSEIYTEGTEGDLPEECYRLELVTPEGVYELELKGGILLWDGSQYRTENDELTQTVIHVLQ